MLKVAPLQKFLFTESALIGFPCILIDFTSEKADEVDVNSFLTDVLKFSYITHVFVKGNVSEQPEIVTVIKGLSFKGKTVLFSTAADESIDSLRMVKNVRFVVSANVPTEEKNTVNARTLASLQDYDELKLIVSNDADYQSVKDFLKNHTITRPTVVLDIREFDDKAQFLASYLSDVEYFNCKTKIAMKYLIS